MEGFIEDEEEFEVNAVADGEPMECGINTYHTEHIGVILLLCSIIDLNLVFTSVYLVFYISID